jgi:hypothetical protein
LLEQEQTDEASPCRNPFSKIELAGHLRHNDVDGSRKVSFGHSLTYIAKTPVSEELVVRPVEWREVKYLPSRVVTSKYKWYGPLPGVPCSPSSSNVALPF